MSSGRSLRGSSIRSTPHLTADHMITPESDDKKVLLNICHILLLILLCHLNNLLFYVNCEMADCTCIWQLSLRVNKIWLTCGQTVD